MRHYTKTLVAGLAAIALSGSAFALDYGKTQATDDMRASKLIGTSVVNNAKETIGEIDEIVLAKNGSASHAVIGVGGFLGIGEKAVAVPFGDLTLARDDDGDVTVTVNATKEDLNAAPTYAYAADKK
jgi:sporulation protein YlmC with PRC-barrel domain